MNLESPRNSISIYKMLDENRSDPVGWEAFFQRYWPSVYTATLKKTGQESLANDIASDVFLKIFRRITNEENPPLELENGSFAPYVGTVMRRVIVDYHRRQPRMVQIDDIDALLDDVKTCWSAEEELEQVLADYFDQYQDAVARLKKSARDRAHSWRMLLRVYRDGETFAALKEQEATRKPASVTRAIRRELIRLIGLMWGSEWAVREAGKWEVGNELREKLALELKWKRELLLELVSTYGDPSESGRPVRLLE